MLNLSSQKLALPASLGTQIAVTIGTLLLLAVGVLNTAASHPARDFVFVSSSTWFFALLLSAGLHLVLSNNSEQSWKYWLIGASAIFLCQITILAGAIATA
jgi:hypothetical protein